MPLTGPRRARLLEVFRCCRCGPGRTGCSGRAVSWLVRDCGVRQFIDIGCGLPTVQNTHQVARGADAAAGWRTSSATRW